MTGKKGQVDSSDRARSQRAVLIDLDNTAFHCRKIVMEAMAGVLEEKGITLTRHLFIKHFLDAPPSEALEALLNASGKQRLSREKLLAELEEATKAAVLEKVASATPQFSALVKAAQEKGWLVGAVTCLDVETAGRMLEKCGMAAAVNVLLPCGTDTEKHFPTSDVWLRLAKQMNITPRRCGVVASCAVLVQAALSCGMRVFATPDDFTSFQDFGGAEAVYEKFDEAAVRNIVEILAGG